MFTLSQIKDAHAKVQTGAGFPAYIQELKKLGVLKYETMVTDSRTTYSGHEGSQVQSEPLYPNLTIADHSKPKEFKQLLQNHQQGHTTYFEFCKDCANTGVEKWLVDLDQMTCTYFDKTGKDVLMEVIPG